MNVYDDSGRLIARGQELDPVTGRPLDRNDRPRLATAIKQIKVHERDLPARRGYS